MYDQLVKFMDYIRSLNWTAEQIQFLALVLAAFFALYFLVRLVTWPFRARARRREKEERTALMKRLEKAEATVSTFDKRVENLGLEQVGVHEALRQIATNRVTMLSTSVEAPLNLKLDIAILQRLDTWMQQSGLTILDGMFMRLASDRMAHLPENLHTCLGEAMDRRIPGLFDGWLANDSDQLSNASREAFRGLMKGHFASLPATVREPLYERLNNALTSLVHSWIDDGGDDTLHAEARTAFATLLRERFGKLPIELRDKLNPKIDQATLDQFDSFIENGDRALNNAAAEAFRSLINERAANLPEKSREALLAKVDATLVEIIGGWADDSDDDDIGAAAKAAFDALIADRAAKMPAETRQEIWDKIDEGIKSRIEGWCDDSDDDDVRDAADTIFKALLLERGKSLPEDTRNEIFEKIDGGLRAQIESWLEDTSEDDDFNEAAGTLMKSLLEERLKQIPDSVRSRIYRKIDEAFRSEADNILDNLDDHEDLTEVMQERLKAFAKNRLQ